MLKQVKISSSLLSCMLACAMLFFGLSSLTIHSQNISEAADSAQWDISITDSSMTLSSMGVKTLSKDGLEYQTSMTNEEVTFAPVVYTASDAWVSYSLTLTNKGSVSAKLSEYDFDVSELDTDVYSVYVPMDLKKNQVLKPKESCTVEFIVKAEPKTNSMYTDSQVLSVRLVHELTTEQDEENPVSDKKETGANASTASQKKAESVQTALGLSLAKLEVAAAAAGLSAAILICYRQRKN